MKVRRELGHLVQEERAAVRLLERPPMGLDRTCERTPLMPKELALDELSWKPTAVDGHKRTACSRASFVQGLRDVLLADARLASNQNGPGQGRKAIDLGHDGKHPSRFDDEPRTRAVDAVCPQHAKLRAADSNHRSRPKQVPANSKAVDPGAVGAAEVTEAHTLR